MSNEFVNIHTLLIERIRELRMLKEKASSHTSINCIEDMLDINRRIYFHIFGREL